MHTYYYNPSCDIKEEYIWIKFNFSFDKECLFIHNLASCGKISGLNFKAAFMFPLIFIFPCMNAS